MKKRVISDSKELQLFTKRFYPAGTYNWPVPPGCTEVEVFIVGGGAGGRSANGQYKAGCGGGYTKTFRGKGYVKPSSGTWMGTYYDGRDGDAISVTPGEKITIVVGKGGATNSPGSASYFKSPTYQAEGGKIGGTSGSSTGIKYGGNGGSGGGAGGCDGGTDGGDGKPYINNPNSGYGGAGDSSDGNRPGGDGTVLIRYWAYEE